MSKLLIICDTLGRSNGAHVATRLMVSALSRSGVHVDLLLSTPADDLYGIENITQITLPFPRNGIRWLVQGVYKRLKFSPVPRWVIDPIGKYRKLMKGYDTVLVIGENSHYRHLVSGLKGPHKVVFIHTDYVPWKIAYGWAVDDSRFDRVIYDGFDLIAVVGQPNADRFAAYYPEFKNKVCTFHNLFSGAAGGKTHGKYKSGLLRIVTVTRLEWGPPKNTERIVRVAGGLKRRGCKFDWTVYGGGLPDVEARLSDLARSENVIDVLHFAGHVCEMSQVWADADLHVLLSAFEGAPNVVIESQVHGVPCVATDVGAVREMIDDGVSGMVLPSDDNVIVSKMEQLLKSPSMIDDWRKALREYTYDNEVVMTEYRKILRIK